MGDRPPKTRAGADLSIDVSAHPIGASGMLGFPHYSGAEAGRSAWGRTEPLSLTLGGSAHPHDRGPSADFGSVPIPDLLNIQCAVLRCGLLFHSEVAPQFPIPPNLLRCQDPHRGKMVPSGGPPEAPPASAPDGGSRVGEAHGRHGASGELAVEIDFLCNQPLPDAGSVSAFMASKSSCIRCRCASVSASGPRQLEHMAGIGISIELCRRARSPCRAPPSGRRPAGQTAPSRSSSQSRHRATPRAHAGAGTDTGRG